MTSSLVLHRPRVLFGSLLGWRQSLGERLRGQGCEVLDVDGRDRQALLSALSKADIVLCSPQQGFVLDAELIDAAPRLRAVNSVVIGVETIDVDACTSAGVLVANGAIEENFLGVAEATVMLILALGLDLKAKERAMRATGTRPAMTRARLLREHTVGLIGLGRIGRSVAQRLAPFGVRLIGYDPYVTAWEGVGGVSLEELLTQSDVVSIHVMLTRETRGMIGARELALMKPQAYLINTSRGHIVDEAALAEALNTGRLAAAAIDTFAEEPTPLTNPLFQVDPDRLILTGHCIAHSARIPELLMAAAEENVLREASGEQPEYLVNPQVLDAWLGRMERLASQPV
jgi:D-3-phosphoglycerate dehydrogenase / 2-oxoglutarate reductase